ncbi:hypothetical protein CHELA1G11_21103 [Hyphomicrobiales bacterium]|nr:hypothetical protein CHELA1G11_21103 [Hyphomicrobiales bacterium]CAH1693324.1 hypothetical protein CHELA1G2_21411 [Hyphomicrobiales bacterium]
MGCENVIRTCVGDTTSTEVSVATCPRVAARTFLLRMRSNVNFTSSAVNGAPSCHLTPSRRLKVQTVASALVSQDVARDGSTSSLSLVQRVRPSPITLIARISERPAEAVIGYPVGIAGTVSVSVPSAQADAIDAEESIANAAARNRILFILMFSSGRFICDFCVRFPFSW